jgi:hypothetical protein
MTVADWCYTADAFPTGHPAVGYGLAGFLTALVVLVSTTDVCLPSLVYRSISGFPLRREARQ